MSTETTTETKRTAKTITAEVQTLIDASPIAESDLRSALGMARHWIDERKELKLSAPELGKLYQKRDELATALVDCIREATKPHAVAALAAARAKLNAPHIDLGMAAFRSGAQAVGSTKKNEKLGL